MNLMNSGLKMKPPRVVYPSKLTRPIRRTLNSRRIHRGADRNGADFDVVEVALDVQQPPVHQPRPGTVNLSFAMAATSYSDRSKPSLIAEPSHEIVEDLFREARSGKFDVFSKRLKLVIQHYAALSPSIGGQDAASVGYRPFGNALATARQRGTEYARLEWQNPENLPLQAAAAFAGVSDNTINARRQTRQIYALVAPSRSRGYRYPRWQFKADSERLKLTIQTFFESGQDNCWILHSFLLTPTETLNGCRPCEWITDSATDLSSVLRLIRQQFS